MHLFPSIDETRYVAPDASVSIDETSLSSADMLHDLFPSTKRHVAADASVSIDETSLSSADMLHQHAVEQPQINVSHRRNNPQFCLLLHQHAVEQTQTKDETDETAQTNGSSSQTIGSKTEHQTAISHLHQHL